MERPSRNLRLRILSSLAMAAAALLALWLGGLAFTAFWLLAAIAAGWEWAHLTARPTPRWVSVAIGAAVAASVPLGTDISPGPVLVPLLIGFAVVAAGTRGNLLAAAGVFYAGAIGIAPVLLRADAVLGIAAILWLFAVVWGTDIAAYFTGRAIGGPKLWVAVSPGKTWSGALGGALFSVLAGVAVAWSAGAPRLAPVALLALLASVLAQAGDLFESALKRRAGVKDSGRLIPGHGGVMDRLDGFVVAAAFAALVGMARAGTTAAGQGLLWW